MPSLLMPIGQESSRLLPAPIMLLTTVLPMMMVPTSLMAMPSAARLLSPTLSPTLLGSAMSLAARLLSTLLSGAPCLRCQRCTWPRPSALLLPRALLSSTSPASTPSLLMVKRNATAPGSNKPRACTCDDA